MSSYCVRGINISTNLRFIRGEKQTEIATNGNETLVFMTQNQEKISGNVMECI